MAGIAHLLTAGALQRGQMRRLTEDVMRAWGFGGWTWPEPSTGRRADADLFEAWLIERWRREVRSDSFRQSVQYERLRAEWEREG